MTTVTSLGVDQLSLRGSGTDYNILSRFFATKAQADAALADSSWVPTAGKSNACITGDQGILVYDFGTSALVVADSATRAYVDTEVAAAVAALVDSAPGTLDTLNELAAAINDDANAFTTLQTAIAAVQTDVDQNESDADAAIAAVQADVDQNESDADAAIAAVQADVDQNEADADAAIAAVQADVDANETAANNAIAAVQADVDQNEADADAAIAAVQADVDANETAANAAIALKADIASPTFTGTPAAPTAADGTNTTQLATTAFVTTAVANLVAGAPGAIDTLNELAAALGDDANFSTTITNSIAAVQADVDQNEVDSDAAEAALSGRIAVLEADPTTAAAVAAVQADVDQNEADADAALLLKAPLASPALTGTPTAPTAAADTNTTQIATTAYVQTEIADLIGNAPAGLNTLEELATAINNDTLALQNQTTLTNANTADIADIRSVTGTSDGSTHLGNFSGAVITDGVAIKTALQELSNAIETNNGASALRTALGITENNGDPADGRGMYYDTGASKYLLST